MSLSSQLNHIDFYTYHSFSHPQGNHHKTLFIIDLRAHSSNSEPSHQACCLRWDCCRCWWSVRQERHLFDLSGNNERGSVTGSCALLSLSSLPLYSNSISYHTRPYLHQRSIRLWKNELLRTWSKSESTFKLVCFAVKLHSPLSWYTLCKTRLSRKLLMMLEAQICSNGGKLVQCYINKRACKTFLTLKIWHSFKEYIAPAVFHTRVLG